MTTLLKPKREAFTSTKIVVCVGTKGCQLLPCLMGLMEISSPFEAKRASPSTAMPQLFSECGFSHIKISKVHSARCIVTRKKTALHTARAASSPAKNSLVHAALVVSNDCCHFFFGHVCRDGRTKVCGQYFSLMVQHAKFVH